jgi:ribosomal protein S3AE
MHLTRFTVQKKASPIDDEFLKGIGGDYMNAYGPVGTRDLATLKTFQDIGIDSYFSGCITLTLPKQKIVKPKKEYICIVDIDELNPKVEKKLLKMFEGQDIEIKKMSSNRISGRIGSDTNWAVRERETVKMLTIFQNAKCVITRRLHVSLPCLAMEVPVFVIFHKTNNRWSPYKDWMHMVTPEEFLRDEFDYDFLNPKPNPTIYLETREKLIKDITSFVDDVKNIEKSPDELRRTTYTDAEVIAWRHDLMKDALNSWLPQSMKLVEENKKLKAANQKMVKISDLKSDNKRREFAEKCMSNKKTKKIIEKLLKNKDFEKVARKIIAD